MHFAFQNISNKWHLTTISVLKHVWDSQTLRAQKSLISILKDTVVKSEFSGNEPIIFFSLKTFKIIFRVDHLKISAQNLKKKAKN